jgi:superfamily II DNA helicase RecQ
LKADDQCKFVCNQLRKFGIKADLYHAKMSDIEKEQVQEGWKSGRIQCIVATIAFGMVSPDCKTVTEY